MNNYFSIKNYNYSYKNDFYNLFNINLKLEVGRRYLLDGNKNSGKSTLLKFLSLS